MKFSQCYYEISPLLLNSIEALLQAVDSVVHTQNFNSNQLTTPPTGQEHIWKTDDPVIWFRYMFKRSIEEKTEFGVRVKETEIALKSEVADDYKSVLAEMIDRRVHAEEQLRLNDIQDRAELQRIYGADRNNNIFLRIRDRFGEYSVQVIRDQLLEEMANNHPNDYPQGANVQPELIRRERRQENENGNEF